MQWQIAFALRHTDQTMNIKHYTPPLNLSFSSLSRSTYSSASITDFYDHTRSYEPRLEAWVERAISEDEQRARQTVRNIILACVRNQAHERITNDPVLGSVLIDLSGLGLTSIPPIDELSGKVTSLDLSNNQITELPAGIFTQLVNLRYLHLTKNQIHTISQGAFQGLDNISQILLNHNNLWELPHNLFEELNQKCTILLSQNHFSLPYVQDIQRHCQREGYQGPSLVSFNKTSSLEKIPIPVSEPNYEGKLEAWTEDPAIDSAERTTRKVLKNQLVKRTASGTFNQCGLIWPELDLSEKGLTALPPLDGLRSGLVSLNLSGNKIQVIPDTAFHGLKSLKRIILDNNHIHTIHHKAFLGLENIQSISVVSNCLNTLPANAFSSLHHRCLVNLDIHLFKNATVQIIKPKSATAHLTGATLVGVHRSNNQKPLPNGNQNQLQPVASGGERKPVEEKRLPKREVHFNQKTAEGIKPKQALSKYKGLHPPSIHTYKIISRKTDHVARTSNSCEPKSCKPKGCTQARETEALTPNPLTHGNFTLLSSRLEDWCEEVKITKSIGAGAGAGAANRIKERYVLAEPFRHVRWHNRLSQLRCVEDENPLTIEELENLEYRMELDERIIQQKLNSELDSAIDEKSKPPKLSKARHFNLFMNEIIGAQFYSRFPVPYGDTGSDSGKVYIDTVSTKNPVTRKTENHDIHVEYETLPKLHNTVAAWSQGKRNEMEDAHIADTFNIQVNGKTELIEITGVFDGHAGKNWSEYAKKHIIDHLQYWLQAFNSLGFSDRNTWNAIKIAFVTLNNTFCKERPLCSGTTAVVSLKINGDRWVANLGDSRAVEVDSKGSARTLTEDAAPEKHKYKKSIICRGGDVTYVDGTDARVNGLLAMARKLGDDTHTSASSRPKITRIPKNELTKKQLLLYCDGFSEIATPAQVAMETSNLLKKRPPALAAALITSRALASGSKDNLTFMITPMD